MNYLRCLCVRALVALPVLVFSSLAQAVPVSMFEGKTLEGWGTRVDGVWRVEDGEIVAGKLDSIQPRNEFLTTTREYTNFEMRLQYKRLGNNGGIQFRSQRIPNHHEMIGFQADLAPKIDGSLYDESRRNRVLAGPTPEVVQQLQVQPDGWTRYRIRAEGARIRLWINDILTVDYTELDPPVPRSGLIALQIHGGASQIRYKDLVIEELPDSPVAPDGAGVLRSGDTVGLIGGANLERTRFNGFLQTGLFSAKNRAPRVIRNLAWEGDTVFEQWRDVNFPGIQGQLEGIGATLVLAQFGGMESLNGPAKLSEFVAAYEKLLGQVTAPGRRVVLLSPTPFEKNRLPNETDLSRRNPEVALYTEAIRDLARRHGLAFVDLFQPFLKDGAAATEGGLTTDGIHLTEAGHRAVAVEICRQLGTETELPVADSPLRTAAVESERLWFNYWRPMNWAFLEGDRATVPFSRDWKDGNKRLFAEEMQQFKALQETADANVRQALAGEPLKPIVLPPAGPVEPPSVPPEAPEEELATLNVHRDYEVNLFASERDGIAKVVQIRWDERGRLWALCIPGYPQTKPGAAPSGRLVICEDTDHDGRADRFTVFADGLDMPLGFELGDGGVYLAASSELWHLSATDGGDKADRKRIVFGGFGTGDTHQTINSLSWGFGGELWFSQGHSIYSRVETPYGIEQHDRAGLWRLRPRTRQLDNFFNNSSAGANNWGVLTDDFGQVFHKEGAAKGAYYSVPGLIRGDLALPSEAMNVLRSEKAKTVGFDLIGTRHFPEELQGNVVIGGEYDNTLQIHKFGYENGRFTSTQGENIIETKNKAFRPVDVRMGPDGGIYFADWYNPIVGHYQASYRHPDRNTTHGRIWRVVRKGRALAKPPVLAGASVPELLAQLSSPERWVKYQARRVLFSKESGVVASALDEWIQTLRPEQDGALMLQALGLFEAHEQVRPGLLRSLLRHEDYRIRAYATRALSVWARAGKLPEARQWLEEQVADEHSQVRLEAVVAASYLPDPKAAVIAARVLDRPMDAYLTHALVKSLYGLKEFWAAPLEAGSFAFEKESHLLFALKNARLPKALDMIRKRIDSMPTGAAGKEEWLSSLAEIGAGPDMLTVLQQGRDHPRVLDALLEVAARRNVVPVAGPDVAGLLEGLLQNSNPGMREKAVRLGGLWKVRALEGAIEAVARDASVPAGLRQAALGSLARIQGAGSVPLLRQLLATAAGEGDRTAILGALLLASPADAVAEALGQLGAVDSQQKAVPILKVFLASKSGAAALEKALTQADALRAEQARHALNAMNTIGGADKAVLSALMKLAGFSAALPVYNKETISAAVADAAELGNAVEGRKVFEQAGCVACHAANGPGGRIGPDLSALSRGLPPDMIVTEVLWPALNIKEGYEAASVTLKTGKLIAGFKQGETAESIAVRDMTSGEIQTIAHADAASVRLGGTVMPDGLTAALSRSQVAHLMRYLFELGK